MIESLSDDELFDKKHFSRMETTNLESYCIPVVASPYDWAMKKIKQNSKHKST
ncbi:MAG: ClbS/DfsB family four-helix bundle protein [Clostridiales bacterium]|nr:ClbS/DfsB family four-helix bundle protein [Clostridiales bacterium]